MTDGIDLETSNKEDCSAVIQGSSECTKVLDGPSETLYEALGVTKEGKCLRHPTCPVLNPESLCVIPCRVCFSEEKSVGIRQNSNQFQTVVHELHRQSLSNSSLNGNGGNHGPDSNQNSTPNANSSFSSVVSDAYYDDLSPLESIVKRLTQVHNWQLRQKEKEILTMKLQMKKMEQKLQAEMASNQELKTTVKSLRKTIQQDMRVIRHMQDTTTANVGSPEKAVAASPLTATGAVEQNQPGPDRQLQRAFQSFRGGLLDIPKSPPPAVAGGKKKKQIDQAAMGALQMKTPGSTTKEIPLDVLAAKLARKPGGQRKISGKSPEQFFPDTVASHPGLPKLDQLAEEPEEVESIKPEKTVFTVTGAVSQDKFGDEGRYTGQILVTTGLPHGKGRMEYESGRIYEGDWVSGQWDGKGQLQNPNGDSYHGEFCLDARHGKGVYKWDNGDVYTGEFRSDKRHGKGQFDFFNGNKYVGEFCNGMFQGYGKYEFAGGYYEGDWKEGRYDGSGELQYANGGKYTGEFRNSVAHGFGMELLPDGRKRRGVWKDGKPSEAFDSTPKEEDEDPRNDLD